ncbi:hypothetical protein Q7C18_15910 [Nesterenkonia sp. CL21]|uniref:BadF/BadG/BcrA/BcrD ATPase family protein n=2 Tax=Bacteria TaxID=2 RepID=UPI00287A46A7|nr:BadF/BadG/BcrA/BcrD ATPase family protein [Nesterenkonia sp. CL21]MDS2174190.1 hypothetical protein [Nesterenkonia sp. CL21]
MTALPPEAGVLGLDIGGSGSRIAWAGLEPGPREVLTGPRVRVSASGSSVPQLARELLDTAARTWPERMRALHGVGVGATGVASLVRDPARLAAQLTGETACPAAVAVDAVTAHLGALGGAGGAVVVLGTGAIAVGHPGPDATGLHPPQWRRVDGWGHLLGDRGGGAWVGRHGLELAMRTHDGVDASDAHDPPQRRAGEALLAAARRRFGEPATWPGQLYTREDRAGVLGEFARDVIALADGGDPASDQLLRQAGREAAQSALAALVTDGDLHDDGAPSSDVTPSPSVPADVVLTGGLARAGSALTDGFAARITEHSRTVTVRQAAGDPLDGALTLARLAAGDRLSLQDGAVWI